MIRIIADAAVQSTLEGITETNELRGTNGELLGFFSPTSPETATFYAEAAASLDRKEIKRRHESTHAVHSTAEVLGRMGDAGRQ